MGEYEHLQGVLWVCARTHGAIVKYFLCDFKSGKMQPVENVKINYGRCEKLEMSVGGLIFLDCIF